MEEDDFDEKLDDDEKPINEDVFSDIEIEKSSYESEDDDSIVDKSKEKDLDSVSANNLPEEIGVINSEIVPEMKKAYLDYAMSVIVSRAIPAIEDGMKPVQRRILYAMKDLGLKPGAQNKKSARVVGDVIGKYHPHGDSAVYEAMVRMAQDFSLRYPLVFGQGNFGSIDGDPAAAMRYTEVNATKLTNEVLEDLDKETVDFIPNYDGSLKEPLLLPGKFPALILNGASGIAVGMATNIPPHNLREVADAIVKYIDNPNISVEELCTVVSGPDFPTGGIVQGNMIELYKTGRGKLIVRGKTIIEEGKKKNAVVITEIPYMVNKATLITQIAELIRDKKLKDISDLRDESSKGKIRIVIEMKKDIDPKFVINALYKYTRLQDSFSVNFLALVKGKPKILGLRDVLQNYVEYRKNIITKRVKFDLNKAELRQEIVDGLLKAIDNLDEVIEIIRHSENPSEKLAKKFKFTENQVRAILETKLRQLTSMEQNKLKDEHSDLESKINEFKKILGDMGEILKIIKKEVLELKEKYGDPRRTQVLKRTIGDISEKDLVQEKEVVISITDKGYVKRMDVQTYKEQKRGGKGVIGSNLATDDFTRQLLTCSTHDYLLFFTSRGRVLWLKAYDIPESERYGKGKALVNLLGLKEERVTKIISIKKFDDFLVMATKKGMIKRISLDNFSKPRASGVKAINLPMDNSDDLIGVEIVRENQEIILATKDGKAIRFDVKCVRPMGRSSYGVTGIKLDKGDEVVSLEVLDTDAIFTITKNGYGKRTAVEDYRKTARAGKGVINLKVSDKTGRIVNTVSVNNGDSIIVTTAKGMVIRTNLEHIRVMGRQAQGVKIVNLHDGDFVSDVCKVADEE